MTLFLNWFWILFHQACRISFVEIYQPTSRCQLRFHAQQHYKCNTIWTPSSRIFPPLWRCSAVQSKLKCGQAFSKLPWRHLWQFVHNFLFFFYSMHIDCCISCVGDRSQAISEVNILDVGVATHGVRLWGQLDVQPNSTKRLWRPLMVQKRTLNSRSQRASCALPRYLLCEI